MARFHAKSVAHYIDEFDFSGDSNALNIAIDNNLGEATAFADVDAVFLEGKSSWTATVNGFFNTSAYDAEMFADLTTVERRLAWYQDNVAGSFGMEGKSNPAGQARASVIDGAAALNVDWQGTDPLFRSVLLQIDTAIGSSADSAAVQFGAVGVGQTIVGVIRLLDVPGGAGDNDLDVVIASDDVENFGGTPETQLTFTTIDQDSVALFEVKTAAGAITDDWWRAEATVAGAGSRTWSILVTFGIKPT